MPEEEGNFHAHGILNSKDGYTQGKDSHDNHIKHGTASSQLIIVNKILYHGLVRNFAGKSQKWHLFAITRLPVDNIFEGFPLDEMRKVAAAYGNDCVPRRLGMVSAAYVRRHKKVRCFPQGI